MNPTHNDFINALEYLVSIEPEPDTFVHMEDYDQFMAPYENRINQAYATIKSYGEQIADNGLDHMRVVLDEILQSKSDPKSYAVISSTVNWQWNGIGEWQA